jgi:hypothetical protein
MSFSPILLFHICSGTIGVGVRLRGHLLAQRFPPSSRGWKRIFHIHAGPGRKRGLHGVHEIPSDQCYGRRYHVVFGSNVLGDSQAQRGGTRDFRLGWASHYPGAWSHRGNLWCASSAEPNGDEVWNASLALFSLWFRGSACCRGRRSHARAPRHYWHTTPGASSLAHVLCVFHRLSVHIPGTATPVPRPITQNIHNFSPGHHATDIDDVLAGPRSVCKSVQEKAGVWYVSARNHRRPGPIVLNNLANLQYPRLSFVYNRRGSTR